MSSLQKFFSNLVYHIDPFLLFGGSISLILFVFVSKNIYLFGVGIVFLLSPILYRVLKSKDSFTYYINDDRTILIINLMYPIFYAYIIYTSLFILHESAIYFLSIVALSILIMVELFFIEKRKNNRFQMLLKIMLLGFLIRFNIFYKSYGVYGVDSQIFRLYIMDITTNGFLNPQILGHYIGHPLYLINTAIFTSLTNLNIKYSIFISMMFPWMISTYLLYIISNKLLGGNNGLLSVFLFIISDFSINDSLQGLGWTFAFPLYIMFLYYVYNLKDNKKNVFMLILISIVVTLTHPVSQLILFIIISIPLFVNIFFEAKNSIRNILLPVIYFLMPYSFYSYASYFVGNEEMNFIEYMILNIQRQLETVGLLGRPETGISLSINEFFVKYFNVLGYSILLFFGFLYIIKLLKKNNEDNLIIYTTLVLFIIPLMFGLVGKRTITPYRWFIYLYAPLSILSAKGIKYTIQKFKGFKTQIIMLLLISSLYAYSMTYNNVGYGKDTTIFNSENTRVSFYESEYVIGYFLKHSDDPITSELFTIYAITRESSKSYSDYLNKSYQIVTNSMLNKPGKTLNNFIWLESFSQRVINVDTDAGRKNLLLEPNNKQILNQNMNCVYSNKKSFFFYSIF